jgi:hypothetical protein
MQNIQMLGRTAVAAVLLLQVTSWCQGMYLVATSASPATLVATPLLIAT